MKNPIEDLKNLQIELDTLDIVEHTKAEQIKLKLDEIIKSLENKITHLERENYGLKQRIYDDDGLENAMQRNGFGTVSKPPKRRL